MPKIRRWELRQLGRILKRNGYPTARWTVGKMMRYLGLRAIYSKPRTTVPAPQNAKYPYLLHDIEIDSPDQVWAIDITLFRGAAGMST
ncbi:MAG: hypothetical protein R3F19_12150 [Verrucomicrobiales bacterium]